MAIIPTIYYFVARICFFSLARRRGKVEDTNDVDILSRLDLLLLRSDAFEDARESSERELRSIVEEYPDEISSIDLIYLESNKKKIKKWVKRVMT